MARSALNSTSRKELLAVLNVAKAAVGRGLFVPVLSHFCFTGDSVIAYDDTCAITIAHDLPVKCAVPADLLLKLLNSLSADDMRLELEGTNLKVACGRSNLKVPALTPDAFIYKEVSRKSPITSFEVTEALVQGIERCLVSVGVDPTHPSQLGVTLVGGDVPALYSTDNVTMSKAELLGYEMPDLQVILPTEFCKHLAGLFGVAKLPEGEAPVLSLWDTYAIVTFGEWGTLYTKLINDTKPLDFAAAFDRMMQGRGGMSIDVPPAWDMAFGRAAAVVNPTHPVVRVIPQDGELGLSAKSQFGETDDLMVVDDQKPGPEFLVDPAHVIRVSKLCTQYACLKRALLMTGKGFTHLISHCTE